MTGEDGTDPVIEVIKDNAIVRILFASVYQIKRINAEEFIPLVPSFGLVLYSFGLLFTLILLTLTFGYQALSDGLSMSDISSAGTTLFIGLVIIYVIIYQIASHVNILTGKEDENINADLLSTYQATSLTILGIVFWAIAFALRVHFVPGIDPNSYYTQIWTNTLPAIGFLVYAIAMDLIYIGMVLVGAGIIAQGVYSIYSDSRTDGH